MSSELKPNIEPCPLPGCEGLIPEPGFILNGWRFELSCENCGRTVASFDESDAIAAWNRRADGWRPIETAPKDGRPVLTSTLDVGGYPTIACYQIETMTWHQAYNGRFGYIVESPTHWMPLPAPPESEVERE